MILGDELIYSGVAKSVGLDGGLRFRGASHLGHSVLHPLALGPFFAVVDAVGALLAIKVAQALLMALAAIPAYLLARRVSSHGWSLAVAALTALAPWTGYATLLTTEALFYPVFVTLAWAAAGMLERPTWGRQASTLALAAAAALVKPQAFVLLPAIAAAIVRVRRDLEPSSAAAPLRPRARRARRDDRGGRRDPARLEERPRRRVRPVARPGSRAPRRARVDGLARGCLRARARDRRADGVPGRRRAAARTRCDGGGAEPRRDRRRALRLGARLGGRALGEPVRARVPARTQPLLPRAARPRLLRALAGARAASARAVAVLSAVAVVAAIAPLPERFVDRSNVFDYPALRPFTVLPEDVSSIPAHVWLVGAAVLAAAIFLVARSPVAPIACVVVAFVALAGTVSWPDRVSTAEARKLAWVDDALPGSARALLVHVDLPPEEATSCGQRAWFEQQALGVWTEFFNTRVDRVAHVYGQNEAAGIPSPELVLAPEGGVLVTDDGSTLARPLRRPRLAAAVAGTRLRRFDLDPAVRSTATAPRSRSGAPKRRCGLLRGRRRCRRGPTVRPAGERQRPELAVRGLVAAGRRLPGERPRPGEPALDPRRRLAQHVVDRRGDRLGSVGSKSRAPSPQTSPTEPESAAATGQPQAIASSGGKAKPS